MLPGASWRPSAASVRRVEADRIEREGRGRAVSARDREGSGADPAGAGRAGEDRLESLDGPAALEDEPPDVVRVGDVADGVDRIVRRDDPAASGEVLEAGGVDRHKPVSRWNAAVVELGGERPAWCGVGTPTGLDDGCEQEPG